MPGALLAGALVSLPAAAQAAFTLDSGLPGPRVVVVGGIHGDEPSGARAAQALAEGPRPLRGVLMVLPEANPGALAARTRTAPGQPDLNRTFPEGALAAPLFQIALQGDLVLDLHEEGGAWPEADRPTLVVAPAASAFALDLLEALPPSEGFAFTGGAPAGSLVGELGRLGRRALVVEVPARLPLEARIALHRQVVEAALRLLGLR
jgi:predicted deacylase